MKEENRVTVIVAALNEEKGIGATLEELGWVLENPRYIVVDGGSVDGTMEIAEKMGAEVVVQERRGKGQAIAQGLRYVNGGTRYIVFVDADYTYPAEYVPMMIGVLEENPDIGMVCGNRFNGKFVLRGMSNAFYVGNRFLAFMQYLLNGVKMRDPLTGLRVVRWGILKDWRPKAKGFDVEAELNHHVERRGYRIKEVPVHYRRRLGKKKLRLRDGLTILRRILLENFYDY